MKNLICVSFLILFGQDPLLQKVTKDLSKQSPFLFVHLQQTNHKSSKLYCIKNDDLFRFLYEDSKISTEKYSSLVFEAISKNKVIKYKKNSHNSLQSFRFKENDKFINALKKTSIQQIKNLYFRGSLINKKIDDLSKRQIIYILFLKGIFISIDDESGRYMIY